MTDIQSINTGLDLAVEPGSFEIYLSGLRKAGLQEESRRGLEFSLGFAAA